MEFQLHKRIRVLITLFIIGLVLSGVTAIPLEREVRALARFLGGSDGMSPDSAAGLLRWILTIRDGLVTTSAHYPFLAYGTDWLAFGHIVIAIAFIGVLHDPVRNIWVLQWGMIACLLVIPTAFIFGPIRGIPFYWQLIDCSFGVVGFIPLWVCYRYVRELQRATGKD